MPKTRTILGALALLTGTLLAGASPAAAEMTARDCNYAVSGWSNAKVCVTITYHQPTASQYEIDKVKVEATDIADTKRVEFTVFLWNGNDEAKWQRDGTLNPSNGWDLTYTPNSLRVGTSGPYVTCWGNAYFDAGGTGFFSAAADL